MGSVTDIILPITSFSISVMLPIQFSSNNNSLEIKTVPTWVSKTVPTCTYANTWNAPVPFRVRTSYLLFCFNCSLSKTAFFGGPWNISGVKQHIYHSRSPLLLSQWKYDNISVRCASSVGFPSPNYNYAGNYALCDVGYRNGEWKGQDGLIWRWTALDRVL